MNVRTIIALILLVFVPISVAAQLLEWGDVAVFVTSALAIAPLAIWLSTATEELAIAAGPTVGGLMNALFGNATELIIALVALREGLVDIVKASITGSILGDLLLVLGMAMFLGGLRYKEQEFKPIVARVNGSSMTLAVTAIALPTLVINTSNVVDAEAITNLSIIVAGVLILVYGLTLLFSLRTHSYLYAVGMAGLEEQGNEQENHAGHRPSSNLQAPDPPSLPSRSRSSPWFWVAVLALSTTGIAFESDLFVDVVEDVTRNWGLTPLFTGVILIPFLGDVAGYVTAVRVAIKNNMDLTVSVSMGSSLLVALLVAPVLVLVGQWTGQPMDLNFNLFEVVAIAISVTVVNLISLGGRSNWLDGILLLATYIVLGVAFYYHPA